MAGSGGGPPCPQVAGLMQFGKLVPVTTFFVLWVIARITSGALVAVQLFPLVLIGLLLGGWALLMRLRFGAYACSRVVLFSKDNARGSIFADCVP